MLVGTPGNKFVLYFIAGYGNFLVTLYKVATDPVVARKSS